MYQELYKNRVQGGTHKVQGNNTNHPYSFGNKEWFVTGSRGQEQRAMKLGVSAPALRCSDPNVAKQTLSHIMNAKEKCPPLCVSFSLWGRKN